MATGNLATRDSTSAAYDGARLNGLGVLSVHMSGAHGLKPADSNGLSDPYCICHVLSESQRTHVVRKSLAPRGRGPLAPHVSGGALRGGGADAVGVGEGGGGGRRGGGGCGGEVGAGRWRVAPARGSLSSLTRMALGWWSLRRERAVSWPRRRGFLLCFWQSEKAN